jgi:two-component system sensor histidine kinase KdpD
VGGAAALTAALVPVRDSLSLASVALLYLLVVIASAAVGGTWAGLLAAAASDLLLNWFFVPPFHTFVVDQHDQVIVLVVYVVVGATVAVIVELAARQRAGAERTRTEVKLLARLADRPAAELSLPALLEQIRETFGMSAVAVTENEQPVERVGDDTDDPVAAVIRASDEVTLTAWGPPTLGADHRLLTQMAGAAARILESRRLAEQAERARELDQVDRVRSALLAAVGHDLRTPLAAIKAAVTSLRDSGLHLGSGDLADLHATIEESADRLSDLVANLLDMSRLQAGALIAHPEPTPLEAVAANAALYAGVAVDVEVPDDLFALADPGLLDRVLANLIDNAARYCASVRVRAQRAGERVELAVVDTGPGVLAADRDAIFRPFQRLDDRSTHRGPGLGLAIARGFTEAMGGTLTASDSPGGGLTMTITLPAA